MHASWYKIGIQLDISYHELENLKVECHNQPSYAMYQMLQHWFWNAVPSPTWEAVVTALRSPVVGMNHVAEQLESKYCKPVQHMMGKFITEIEKSMGFVTMCKMQSHLWFTRGTNAVGSKSYA